MVKKGKSYKLINFILIMGLVLFVIVVVFAPKPIDWSISYSRAHDRPLGTKLVYEVMPTLFPGQEFIVSHSSIIDFLQETTPVETNFIFINDDFEPNPLAVDKLIDVVESGNDVFIAAEYFSPQLSDSLGFQIRRSNPPSIEFIGDSVGFNFKHYTLRSHYLYWYKRVITNHHFSSIDTVNTSVLGYNHKGEANYLKIKRGTGAFYINCNPLLYSNYHLLSGNRGEYIFKSLSYLPVRTTVWDEHYKSGTAVIGSEMDFILSNPELQMSWYLLLIGVLIYFVFQSRRRQRPVPVINKPFNNSVGFIDTISRLYLSRQDHLGIARKRFIYFLDFLRSRYYIDTNISESKLIQETNQKSGVSERSVAAIFRMAWNLDKVKGLSREDLQQFSRQLDFFYKNCQ